MKVIRMNALKSFSRSALLAAGMSEPDAETVAEVLLTTDTFGVRSHGLNNLYAYVQKMRAGGLDPAAVPAVLAEGPAWALLDGNSAIGMVSSCKGMDLAIEKAGQTGIGYVGVRNSCHFGAAGYYANMAAKRGMIGIAMSNGDPVMAIPGSVNVAIGNNPLAFALPMRDGKSLFLDIALSSVAALKVVMARDRGDQVPGEWLIDENGQHTSDPSGFPGSSHLTPMAGHKGYGLAILVETLTAVLTGAEMLSKVVSWNRNLEQRNGVGHAFLAVDISQMMPLAEFEDRAGRMVEELKAAPKAPGVEKILVPGEMEWGRREAALSSGKLELEDAIAENLEKLAALTGVKLCWEDQ